MEESNMIGNCMGRRQFLIRSTAVAGGLVLALNTGADAMGAADVEIAIDANSALAKIGGSLVVESPAGKVIVIRTGDSAYSAFSARCTHKGGIVEYDHAKHQLVCPKHSSYFSAKDGAVTAGPAEKPLPSYTAAGSATSVKISLPG